MRLLKIIFNRATVISLLIIFQITVLFFIVFNISNFTWIYLSVLPIFTLIAYIRINNKKLNPSQQILWITLLIVFPLLGLLLYLIFGETRLVKREKRAFKSIAQQNAKYTPATNLLLPDFQGQSDYIFNSLGYPVFNDTSTLYFNSGEKFFESLLKDLKQAKDFIFLEFYIINNGIMWKTILDILVKKVQEGVKVKVVYDDIGTISKFSWRHPKLLRKQGIDCIVFNKYNFITTIAHNNRDHRKIVIIDGKVAYTGGINISDEYINKDNSRHYWKDTAQRIEGNAVRNFTLSFLNMYDLSGGTVDYDEFLNINHTQSQDGYVQPFVTGPMPFYSDTHAINILLNLINQAKKTLYIVTPYFIPDYQIMNALIIARNRGVDVRMIISDIPDKKIVYLITRNNCAELIKNEIKVCRYKDAFVHAKSVLVDNEVGIVGSINFDFRSFVHNFECGIWQYKTNALKQLQQDCDEMFETHGYLEVKDLKVNFLEKTLANILKVLYSIF